MQTPIDVINIKQKLIHFKEFIKNDMIKELYKIKLDLDVNKNTLAQEWKKYIHVHVGKNYKIINSTSTISIS